MFLGLSRKVLGILAVIMLATATGCGSGPATGDSGGMEVEIPFAAVVGSESFTCGTTYENIGTGATGAQKQYRPSDFRFYIHDIRLLNADSEEVPLELEQDGEWQHDSAALLDFENATAPCDVGGDSRTNTTVRGTLPPGDYSGLCFRLGLPFDLNHIDVSSLDSPPPLDLSAMSWSWTAGRKFVRIDGRGDPSGTNQPFFIHLGSTGCVDSEGTPEPDVACANPNVAEVCFYDFPLDGHHRIAADLKNLLEGSDVSTNVNGASGCMSGTADDECAAILPKFDLAFSYTGTSDPAPAVASKLQRFFRVLHEEEH